MVVKDIVSYILNSSTLKNAITLLSIDLLCISFHYACRFSARLVARHSVAQSIYFDICRAIVPCESYLISCYFTLMPDNFTCLGETHAS